MKFEQTVAAEIYVTVKSYYAGRTPPHMQPRNYNDVVDAYAGSLVRIHAAIETAGADRARQNVGQLPPSHWNDCIRQCVLSLASDESKISLDPLAPFRWVRAVARMLGANRRDFERAALRVIGG